MQDSSCSGSRPISITSYAAGDESEICALFNRVFGGSKSIARWEWQFAANPYDVPHIALGRDVENGRMIGHYAVIPVSINWLGRQVKAAQSVDTMTDAEYRRSGIFERTAHACYEGLTRSKFELVYGFPNRAALGGRLRNLTWERLFTLPSYSIQLSCHDFLKRIVPIPVLPEAGDLIYRAVYSLRLSWRIVLARLRLRGLKFHRSHAAPANYDSFWKSVKQSEIISIWKDRAYLAWRYDRCPDRQYEYFFIENESREIAALCVARLSDGDFLLCELMAIDRNARIARYLLSLATNDQASPDDRKRRANRGSAKQLLGRVLANALGMPGRSSNTGRFTACR